MAQVSQEPEIILAQRLASNEKPIRTKALKTLRTYIRLRSQKAEGGFTSEDLLKIWKGLFYCLWMQDKLLQQEEISHKLSGLIHSFHTTDTQLLYFTTFLQTVKREWNGIDNLRLDKFYQLVRFMFRQAFEVLKRRKWEPSMVNQFLHVFTKQLLQNTEHVPKGLLMHVLDLYMTELAQVGTTELTAEQNLTFIHPFFQAMAKTKDDLLLALISKNIFRTILDHAPFAIEDLIRELQQGGVDDSDSGQASGEEEEELKNQVPKKTKVKRVNGISEVKENSKGIKEEQDLYSMDSGNDDGVGPVLQFDYGAVAACLFEFGSRLTTRNTNRKRMYSFVNAFRALNEGIFNRKESDKGEVSDTSDKKVLKKKRKKTKNERLTTGDEPVAKKRKAACQDKQNPSNSPQTGSLNNTTEAMEKERVVLKESDSQDLEAGINVKKKRKSKKVKTISQYTESEVSQEFQESDGENKSNSYEVAMKKNSLKGFGNTQTSTKLKALGQKPEMTSVVEHPVEAAEAECGISHTQENTKKKNKKKKLNVGEDKTGTETGRGVMEKHDDPGEVEASTMKKKRRKSKKLCSSLQEVGEVVAVQSLPKEDIAGDEIMPQKEDSDNNATQSQLGTSTLQPKKVKRTKSSLKNLGVEFKSPAVLENCINILHPTSEEDRVTLCELNASTTRKKKVKSKRLSSQEGKEVDSTSQDSSAVVVKDIATPADEVPCAESQSSKAPMVKTKKSMKMKKATEVTGSKYQVDLDVRDPEVSSDSAHITTTPKNITDECPQSKVKKGKKKKQSSSNEESTLEAKEQPAAEATSTKQTRTPHKKKKIQKKQESQSAEAREESVPTVKEKIRTEVSDTLPSDSRICTPDVKTSFIPMKRGKKKRKLWTDQAEMSQSNGPAEELSGKKVKGIELSTLVTPKKRKMEKSTPKSNFVSFQGPIKPPTPLFCRTKPKVSTPQTSFKHKFQTPKSETKKVTFGLKNNKTTEFRKTDRSLLVSPVGSSRVAFDPKKMPISGVLKSPLPSPVTSVKKSVANKRATAADFF
ncbi:ribosomal RNA processing protein 1 homolog B-like isoform X3 [Tachysurus fulvidraco]|uniref:ribosomal RNA processing protein 1 homolog B-like isoform X3 n=1 Tax=Tachysurus fulvidraco TaxID=1234273 RepID=UPI000F4F9266|nr:ribosomal RNA processing protein 1 homolog B-like isoform X3 [Tachysurus fulvidraco]